MLRRKTPAASSSPKTPSQPLGHNLKQCATAKKSIWGCNPIDHNHISVSPNNSRTKLKGAARFQYLSQNQCSRDVHLNKRNGAMGDTPELFRPLPNRSVRVATGTGTLTGDGGFLLLREAVDRIALLNHLAPRLEDTRVSRRIMHSLPPPLRPSVAMIAPPVDQLSETPGRRW